MKNLFTISSKDVQYVAKKKLGRKLTIEELKQVHKGIEFGLECWKNVAIFTIEELKEKSLNT